MKVESDEQMPAYSMLSEAAKESLDAILRASGYPPAGPLCRFHSEGRYLLEMMAVAYHVGGFDSLQRVRKNARSLRGDVVSDLKVGLTS